MYKRQFCFWTQARNKLFSFSHSFCTHYYITESTFIYSNIIFPRQFFFSSVCLLISFSFTLVGPPTLLSHFTFSFTFSPSLSILSLFLFFTKTFFLLQKPTKKREREEKGQLTLAFATAPRKKTYISHLIILAVVMRWCSEGERKETLI